MSFPRAYALLDNAAADRAFPAGAIEIGSANAIHGRRAAGHLTYDDDAAACTDATIFDLASLTKVIATTSLAMSFVGRHQLDLDARVSGFIRGWDDEARRHMRVRHLLDHSSGLPAHRTFWETTAGRSGYEAALRAVPPEHPPGVVSVYSDLGFMLLGFILEDLGGRPLDRQFADLALEGDLQFRPAALLRPRIAPTEVDAWRGRLLVGEVHDENAAALGGVAGHAGLFGTVRDVGRFAQLVLRTFKEPTYLSAPDLMRTFASKTNVPGSSRALGWDTMLPTSSCGRLFGPGAIGHTGFTGTSIWIDPAMDLYVVLLTNRVHPTRANDELVRVRPLIHEAVIEDHLGSIRTTS